METANVLVASGGDRGNTVPKYGVTAAEIAVLMALHGNDAVFDIEPGDDVERSNNEELARLRGLYGNARDEDGVPLINAIYPGAGAQVHRTIASLELGENLFNPTHPAKPKPDTTTGDPEVAGKGGLSTASPGSVARPSHYEPPEVPADSPSGELESPKNQPQVDLPPGTAINAAGSGSDATKDALAKKAEKGPSKVDDKGVLG